MYAKQSRPRFSRWSSPQSRYCLCIPIHVYLQPLPVNLKGNDGCNKRLGVYGDQRDTEICQSSPLDLSPAEDKATRLQAAPASKALLGVILDLPHEIASYLTSPRLKDNADAITDACKQDIGKGKFEANVAELDFCLNTIIYVCDNLRRWAKDEKAQDIPFANKLLSPKIRKDPLGCVLIIGY